MLIVLINTSIISNCNVKTILLNIALNTNYALLSTIMIYLKTLIPY